MRGKLLLLLSLAMIASACATLSAGGNHAPGQGKPANDSPNPPTLSQDVDEGGGFGVTKALVDSVISQVVGKSCVNGQACLVAKLTITNATNSITFSGGNVLDISSGGYTGFVFNNIVNNKSTGQGFISHAASGTNAFAADQNGARFDFGAGASDYASSDGTTITFATGLAGSSLSLSGTPTFSGATGLQLSNSAPDIFASGTGIFTLESNAADATTSASIPGIALKCDAALTAGDLCVGVKKSDGTVVWSVTQEGGTKMTAQTFTNLYESSTAPTISSGFGTSPSISANNGTAVFRINVGTGGVATTGIIGLPTATTGWNCDCSDVTTHSATIFLCRQTGGTATTANIGQFSTADVAAAWTASDILIVKCAAY